jgi:hypothetical protein
MDVLKYPYSKVQIWFYSIAFIAIFIFILVVFIVDFSDHSTWPLLGGVFLVICALFAYLYRKYFRPLQNGETALELDSEKLQYFIGNKTVYWKDVLYTNFGALKNGGAEIRFALANGIEVIIITRYVAGNDNEIYKNITAYFEKYKSV